MSVRHILLISSSKVHGFEYLECAANDINTLLGKCNASRILFIPYALRDHDGYLEKIKSTFVNWGYEVDAIHQQESPIHAVETAQALFVGGGNTFQLLKALYDYKLIDTIRKKVLIDGVPYIGSSAGSNVATKNICTTNDMPIVYPPSFDALKLVPFNINPHYLDPDQNSKHKGETREERILQYLELSHASPVVGLREGNSLYIEGDTAELKGLHRARLFIPGKEPKDIEPGTNLSYLLQSAE